MLQQLVADLRQSDRLALVVCVRPRPDTGPQDGGRPSGRAGAGSCRAAGKEHPGRAGTGAAAPELARGARAQAAVTVWQQLRAMGIVPAVSARADVPAAAPAVGRWRRGQAAPVAEAPRRLSRLARDCGRYCCGGGTLRGSMCGAVCAVLLLSYVVLWDLVLGPSQQPWCTNVCPDALNGVCEDGGTLSADEVKRCTAS